jgi:hypothetical protein
MKGPEVSPGQDRATGSRAMDEGDSDGRGKGTSPNLEAAVRRARIELAAHSEAADDLRRAEIARLEIIEQAVRGIVAQAPKGVDLFDIGIGYGEKPRLFLDMIAYVDLGPDRRTYRFYQNTRHGRVLIAENANVQKIVAAMTNYVARRLIEREQALASDWRSLAQPQKFEPIPPKPRGAAKQEAPPRRATLVDFASFLLMALGAFVLFLIAAFAAWLLFSGTGRAILAAGFGSVAQ